MAQIGHHTIYKVDDTQMIYIPNESAQSSSSGASNKRANSSAEEKKYKKMFENIDLSSNFYFSYSYDLTRTLQYNLAPPQDVEIVPGEENDGFIWESKVKFNKETVPQKLKEGKKDGGKRSERGGSEKAGKYARRYKSLERFVWNSYLFQNQDLHPDWTLNLIHGFVSQANIAVYGLPIFLTLIARRSSKFAGTRFLKRGANFDGDVANEVETEQIVFDSSVSSFKNGRYTSFVQLRGSVPSHWSQDVSKMVPKPLITLDVADPIFRTPGRHFNDLIKRYGTPICVLNLVKIREKRPHETVLSNEFIASIKYLNQFIPKGHAIKHIPFDMACFNRSKESNVMIKLSDIAYSCLKKTGIFISWPTGRYQSFPAPKNEAPKNEASNRSSSKSGDHKAEDGVSQENEATSFGADPEEEKEGNYSFQKTPIIPGGFRTPGGRTYQTGTVRVNCVDCLDRTNTAQFALGRAALGVQLHVLGVLSDPYLEFDTDTVRMLEELYEDHGDTLALQYGGSQLVHRIKTYRKIAPLSSHSRDIMQTLSRYYSNTFSDSDKQAAINVFLGVFKPFERSAHEPAVWELSTDYYFHNQLTPDAIWPPRGRVRSPKDSRPLTCWWEESSAYSLPLPSNQIFKKSSDALISVRSFDDRSDNADGYIEQYKPNELTILDTTLYSHMLHTGKDFMPYFTTDFSPFRVRPIKRRSIVQSSGLSLKGWFGPATATPSGENQSKTANEPPLLSRQSSDQANSNMYQTSSNMYQTSSNIYQSSSGNFQTPSPNQQRSSILPFQLFSSNPSLSFGSSFQTSPSPSESDEDETRSDFDTLDDAGSLVGGDSESILSAGDQLMAPNFQSLFGGKNYDSVLPNNQEVYGKIIKPLSAKDKHFYDSYVAMGQNSGEFAHQMAVKKGNEEIVPDEKQLIMSIDSLSVDEDDDTDLFEEGRKISPLGGGLNQNCYTFKFRPLSDADKNIFDAYLDRGKKGASKVSDKDAKLYQNYSNDLFLKKC